MDDQRKDNQYDMSAATGSVTFGLSFNTAGGTSTYIHISGGKDLPAPDVAATLNYDANGGTGAPDSEFKPGPEGQQCHVHCVQHHPHEMATPSRAGIPTRAATVWNIKLAIR